MELKFNVKFQWNEFIALNSPLILKFSSDTFALLCFCQIYFIRQAI